MRSMRKTIAFLVLVFLSSLASSTFAAQRFPIDAEQYRQTITSRVEATWDRIEKKLDHHRVSEDRKQAIREAFDEAVARIDELMDKASADGKISRAEAYRISTMTSGLRGKVRGLLAINKGSKDNADKPRFRTAHRAVTSKPATSRTAAKKVDGTPLPSGAPKTEAARTASPNEAPPKMGADAKTTEAAGP